MFSTYLHSNGANTKPNSDYSDYLLFTKGSRKL